MPHRDSTALGAPCWVDLFTSDTARSAAFYGELFGWTAEEPNPDFGGYFSYLHNGEVIAGCMGNDGSQGAPDGWSVYLAVADAEATAAAVVANGGQVFSPPMVIGEEGTMALFADPGGAMIGAWQYAGHTGFHHVGDANTPSWFELHTREYEASVGFYEKAFGWDAYAMPEAPGFRYTTLGDGDDQAAGIMDSSPFAPEGTPGVWSVYFGTDDADATIALALKLGGAVVDPAEDTPYGRLATMTDPTGAVFKLVQGNQ